MGFPKQEYWGQLPFPPPGDLPYPGIESLSLHWQAFTAEPPGKIVPIVNNTVLYTSNLLRGYNLC